MPLSPAISGGNAGLRAYHQQELPFTDLKRKILEQDLALNDRHDPQLSQLPLHCYLSGPTSLKDHMQYYSTHIMILHKSSINLYESN